MIPVSDAKDEPDRHSSVHVPILVTSRPDSTSEEEEDGMALNKGNKSLRDLMVARSKALTSKEASKPQVSPTLPLPPPLPTDLRLNALPDLKKKKPLKDLEEGDVGPQEESKQQKVTKDPHDKRSTSVDSREERDRAEVCLLQRIWSPRLEVDGATIPWNASVRDFQRGHAGHFAEALEQPLFLPKDTEVYRRFKQKNLFLSLKRDFAMVSDLSYP